MAENYSDIESLKGATAVVDEVYEKIGHEGCIAISADMTSTATTAAGAVIGLALGPLGALIGGGLGLILGRNASKKKERERMYEYKLSLYNKAVQVQNALIEKLSNNCNELKKRQ